MYDLHPIEYAADFERKQFCFVLGGTEALSGAPINTPVVDGDGLFRSFGRDVPFSSVFKTLKLRARTVDGNG